MSDAEDMLLNQKPVRLLVKLNHPGKENYASKLSQEIDCTYSHTVRMIQKLEEYNLITSQREGRKKTLELTKKGKNIARILGNLLDQLRNDDR